MLIILFIQLIHLPSYLHSIYFTVKGNQRTVKIIWIIPKSCLSINNVINTLNPGICSPLPSLALSSHKYALQPPILVKFTSLYTGVFTNISMSMHKSFSFSINYIFMEKKLWRKDITRDLFFFAPNVTKYRLRQCTMYTMSMCESFCTLSEQW